jgi:hypothetical protein
LAQSTTDSFKVLSELLAQWPDDESAPLRQVVRGAAAIRDAQGQLNKNALHNLESGTNHPEVGAAASDHVAALKDRLGSPQAQAPLTSEWVKSWNDGAQELIKKLIARPDPPEPPPPPPPDDPPPPPEPSATLCETLLDLSEPAAIDAFVEEVRAALQSLSGSAVRVRLVCEEDGD